MDPFSQPIQRDRSIVVKCIKCQQPLAKIDIQQVYKIGMYVCEPCFLKLDQPKSKTETFTFMHRDYLFTFTKNGEIAINIDGVDVIIPTHLIKLALMDHKND